MQYQVDLQKLVNEALKEEDIQKGVKQANVTKEFLVSEILGKSSDILEAGAKEIEDLNDLKNKLTSAETILDEESPPISKIVYSIENFKYYFIGTIVLIVIGYFVSRYLVGISTVFRLLVIYLPLIFVSVVITEIVLFVLYLLRNKQYLRESDRIVTEIYEK